MPTFIFYKNKVKVDEMKGADAAALEEKIKKWMGDGEEGGDEVTVKGHVCTKLSLVKKIVLCFSRVFDEG